jgi:mannan endo-1,4-beta-mannosidase
MPEDGETVGPSFPLAVHCDRSLFVRAEFAVNGTPVAGTSYQPFCARYAPRVDGPAEISASLVARDGARVPLPGIRVTVRRDMFGRNARVSDRGRGFVFPNGRAGVVVGFNESYTWPNLDPLYRFGDERSVEQWLDKIRVSGVNVLRMMLEYAETDHQLLEKPLGVWTPRVVEFWDRFLPLCERNNISVLLSPWDPFWMNQRWDTNPYNARNGGPCRSKRDWFVAPEARDAQKARLRYVIDRWGASHAIFAIDLLNEFDGWTDATAEEQAAWVDEMARFVREYELSSRGHCHMLTVSSALAQPAGVIGDVVYRSRHLDFATTHLYYPGSVNAPRDAISPADAVADGVRYSLESIQDGRPYTDTESGPRDLQPPWLTNRPAFDEEVHHFMSWAHFASGGCGAGMRWPYRSPQSVTAGMLRNLKALADVAQAFDWHLFLPVNAAARVSVDFPGVFAKACSDDHQALVWLYHDTRGRPAFRVEDAKLTIRGLKPGNYLVRCWNTETGKMLSARLAPGTRAGLVAVLPPFETDIAVTCRPWSAADADTAAALRRAFAPGA